MLPATMLYVFLSFEPLVLAYVPLLGFHAIPAQFLRMPFITYVFCTFVPSL